MREKRARKRRARGTVSEVKALRRVTISEELVMELSSSIAEGAIAQGISSSSTCGFAENYRGETQCSICGIT